MMAQISRSLMQACTSNVFIAFCSIRRNDITVCSKNRGNDITHYSLFQIEVTTSPLVPLGTAFTFVLLENRHCPLFYQEKRHHPLFQIGFHPLFHIGVTESPFVQLEKQHCPLFYREKQHHPLFQFGVTDHPLQYY